MALGAPAASAAVPRYEGASADGTKVFFTTTEQLVPGDTDGRRDVYERSYDAEPGVETHVTREISTGPSGGNDALDALFEKVSADGTRVFFTTSEPLVPADTDRRADVYVRDLTTGATSLVSAGEAACSPGCGNGPADAGFVGAAANGNEVFFGTDERLAAADTDNSVDVYERDLTSGTTTLVSAGEASCAPACGNDEYTATLRGVSADGSRAFFATFEQLSGADTDTAIDVYARDLPSGPTELVSRGAAACAPCGNSNASAAVFAGSSASGGRVFFETDEGLVPGDGDGANDVYERAEGATALISGGSETTPANVAQENGSGRAAIDEGGEKVLFTTTEALDAGADTNEATDVYEWSGGAPALVSSGTCTQGSGCGSTFDAATADLGTLLFTTTEQLDPADEDESADVYEAETAGGSPALVSAGAAACAPGCGNGAAAAIFNASSAEASRLFFTTAEQLAPQDEDSNADIYLRDLAGPSTALVTPHGICPIGGGCNVVFSGASGDGAHAFFQTEERLGAEDVDSEADIYERDLGSGETRLVSTGNSVTLGPATPVLTGTSPASPAESTTPRIVGQADAGSSVKLYTTADCSGVPVATGTAAELASPGIQATVAAGSTTSFRATATDEGGETSGCSGAISYRQETPPPPPPPPPPGEEGSGTTGTGGGGTGSIATQTKTHDGGIAYVTPETLITFGPAFKTRKRKVLFQFTDATGQPGTSFLCRIDRKAWHACSSPQRLRRLRRGKHVFKVKAENAVGAWEAQPTKRSFKVVRVR